ncbi:ninjurin-2-like [Tropilaelaps mercedesae]|uniref:Ninjurin-2-like n=1 Tax=Tropilaelaps mercedesae TaxID=418985 RepID=A0A1V9XNG1_9ACAR|nr:ninjurin-2-like [Tropilaelaps mercedesae]
MPVRQQCSSTPHEALDARASSPPLVGGHPGGRGDAGQGGEELVESRVRLLELESIETMMCSQPPVSPYPTSMDTSLVVGHQQTSRSPRFRREYKETSFTEPPSTMSTTCHAATSSYSLANTGVDGEDGTGVVVNGKNFIMDLNMYATRKTVAQGMMDIALLAANASQLKAVLQQNPQYGARPPWNAACLAFLGLSMTLQMVLGGLLVTVARWNLNCPWEQRRADLVNNIIVVAVFLLTIVNVLLAAFGPSDPAMLHADHRYSTPPDRIKFTEQM